MRTTTGWRLAALLGLLVGAGGGGTSFAEDATLIGWNNLGMHCMDADYGVFALLPPYNTLEAQLVDAHGRLLRDPSAAPRHVRSHR